MKHSVRFVRFADVWIRYLIWRPANRFEFVEFLRNESSIVSQRGAGRKIAFRVFNETEPRTSFHFNLTEVEGKTEPQTQSIHKLFI